MEKKKKRREKEKNSGHRNNMILKFPLNIPSGFEYIYVNILKIVCLFLNKHRYIYIERYIYSDY